MSNRFTLKFKSGPSAGKTFSLGPGEYLFIGSAETCAIRIIDDPTVSPTHACVFHDPNGTIRFKDMGSQFGTFRNGKKISSSIVIRAGDRITLGQISTFQSSWWNALQVTRLTKFSRLPNFNGKSNAASVNLNLKSAHVKIAALCVAIVVSVIGTYRFTQERGQVSQPGMPEASLANVEKDPRKPGGDMGIFSGALSAKLFNTKPKRAAKVRVELTPERKFIWDEIVAISRRFGDPPPSAMDPGFVREVERHLRRFTRGNYHKVMLERKMGFWPQIEKTLTEKGLPVELGYIVWVESNFQLDVVSPAGARGPWQFMPDTAREYGLTVNGTKDERIDLAKTTISAANYFAELLRMFGTERYLLAVASYNSGQNRVKRFQIASTVNKENSSDFWHLRFVLPKETAEYVPKFMAAVIIGRNPERWDLAH